MDENREFQIFENYTKSVCRKIMSQRKKNEVKEELYSHLLEEYERYIALGIDDKTAQQKAVDNMGDKDTLCKEFGRLYSISPPDYMQSSMNFLIWGIILNYLHLELFSGMEKLSIFIGQMLMLYGLLKMRKLNSKMTTTLAIFPVFLIFESIRSFLTMYFSLSETITNLLIVIWALFCVVFYWFVFSGLDKECHKVMHENDKSPHLYFGYFSILVFVSTIAFFESHQYITKDFYVYIPLILAILSLYNAMKILSHKEPEVELNHTLSKGEKWIYGFAVIAFITISFTSMYLSASREPISEVYNPIDTEVSQDDVSSARSNMLELGFPEEYLNDLPDSEVLKYSNAVYLQIGDKFENKYYSEIMEVFFFHFENGGIRALYRIELPDDLATNYRNGFYLEYPRSDFVYANSSNDYTDFNGDFFLALSEKDGQTLSSESFEDITIYETDYYQTFCGYEYSFPDDSTNRRAYIADSAIIQSYGNSQILIIDAFYCYKEYPIYPAYNHFSTLAYEKYVERNEYRNGDFSIKEHSYTPWLEYEYENTKPKEE